MDGNNTKKKNSLICLGRKKFDSQCAFFFLILLRAYPRLKDAQIEKSRYPTLYYQLIKNVRTMYQVCKLVHADLSEYNIL